MDGDTSLAWDVLTVPNSAQGVADAAEQLGKKGSSVRLVVPIVSRRGDMVRLLVGYEVPPPLDSWRLMTRHEED